MEGYKLPNGRIEVGPELKQVLQEEMDRLTNELEELEPKVERELRKSRQTHRKLWNY